jgi:hypothetical protein
MTERAQMSQPSRIFSMGILSASIALSLSTVGCGGLAETAASIAETSQTSLSTAQQYALTLDEASKRRRHSETTDTANVTAGVKTSTSLSADQSSTGTSASPIQSPQKESPFVSETSAQLQPPLSAQPLTQQHTPLDAQLLRAENFEYLGAFGLPQDPIGGSRFGYGGSALAPYTDPATKQTTLFIAGHPYFPGQVAQVEVPANFVKSNNYSLLPKARVMQPFSDITNGELNKANGSLGVVTNGASLYGLLVYNGKIISSATTYYDYAQNGSHGVGDLQLSLSSRFRGFFPFSSDTVAPARALGGAMSTIPLEWQNVLGGKALTGNQSVPIISTTSSGPALTTFDPDSVGSSPNIPGKTLLYYPLSNPLCGSLGCESAKNTIFNQTTMIRGHAFVPGTRSVLFVAKHGIGEYWYGGTTSPTGLVAAPGSDGWGPKSTQFEFRIYAYDVNDLAKVKSGRVKPWEVKPYSIWALPEISNNNPGPNMRGSTFDPDSGLLFITPDYMEQGRVEVYRVRKQ